MDDMDECVKELIMILLEGVEEVVPLKEKKNQFLKDWIETHDTQLRALSESRARARQNIPSSKDHVDFEKKRKEYVRITADM